MTLRQTIHAAPAKAIDLIDKLANTSNQAVKTRENLFAELEKELSLYFDVKEQHLVPLLPKYPETKALAPDAAKGDKELRAQLSALNRLPQDNDEFLGKVTELKKAFQQHVKDERNELLPAVLKALSDDEADETAGKMEAALEKAKEAKRAEVRAESAEAKREKAEGERAQEALREAARVEKAVQRSARDATEKAVETFQQTATSVQDGARRVAQRMAETTTEVASSARDAITIYRGSSEELAEDMRTISALATVSSEATSEVGLAWRECIQNTAALNMNASQQMLQSKTYAQAAQVQREFFEASMRTWLEGSLTVLQITQQASKKALIPLQSRLEKAA